MVFHFRQNLLHFYLRGFRPCNKNKVVIAVKPRLKLFKGTADNSLSPVSFDCLADFFACGYAIARFVKTVF